MLAARRHAPATSCLPAYLPIALRMQLPPSRPSHSLPRLLPLLWLPLSPPQSGARCRRSLLPQPPCYPRLPVLSMGSASISRASPSTRTTPDALHHPLHRHPRRLCPDITGDLPSSSAPPRSRRLAPRVHRELLIILPLSVLSLALCRPSRPIAPPPALVADAAPVTIWSRACVQHAHHRA